MVEGGVPGEQCADLVFFAAAGVWGPVDEILELCLELLAWRAHDEWCAAVGELVGSAVRWPLDYSECLLDSLVHGGSRLGESVLDAAWTHFGIPFGAAAWDARTQTVGVLEEVPGNLAGFARFTRV